MTPARLVSALLGVAFLAGGGFVLYVNAAHLTTPVAVFAGALGTLGGLLIDPVHVGAALAALAGFGKSARDAVKE